MFDCIFEKNQMILLLPLPPSLNQLYEPDGRGGIRKTARARVWQDEMRLRLNQFDITPFTGQIQVMILVGSRRIDLDNSTKLLFDTLEKYCYLNDRQVAHYATWRVKDKPIETFLKIKITRYDGFVPEF